MFIEIELCRSAVMAAARAIDEGRTIGPKLVSLAKARCSDAAIWSPTRRSRCTAASA